MHDPCPVVGETHFRLLLVVEGINKVDVARCDQLMFDENRRRQGFLLKYLKRDGDDFVTITFREVGDCANQPGAGSTEFVAGVEDRVLAHYSAEVAAADLVDGTKRGQRADIVYCADQRTA